MSLFKNIEKLISEHGSAAILRERLYLAEDKYTALDKKRTDAEEAHKKEVQDLKEARIKEVAGAKKKCLNEVARLESALAKATAELLSGRVTVKLDIGFIRALEQTARTHPEDHIRLACVHTLWSLRPDRARPVLEDALNDLSEINRAHARLLLDQYQQKGDRT